MMQLFTLLQELHHLHQLHQLHQQHQLHQLYQLHQLHQLHHCINVVIAIRTNGRRLVNDTRVGAGVNLRSPLVTGVNQR